VQTREQFLNFLRPQHSRFRFIHVTLTGFPDSRQDARWPHSQDGCATT
jgi:hypothetical protein